MKKSGRPMSSLLPGGLVVPYRSGGADPGNNGFSIDRVTMTGRLHSEMDPALRAWLLSVECPPIRYLTERDLIGKPPSARAMASLRKEALAWEPIREIVALQQEDGRFVGRKKVKTHEPTFYALRLMQLCGMDASDGPVSRALDYVARERLREGAFSWTGGGSGVLPCYAGIFTQPLILMAGPNVYGVKETLRWIVDHQRFDHKKTRAGGSKTWPYKTIDNYGGCFWSVSCYHGAVAAFRTLAAVPARRRTREMRARLDAALVYLKIHRVYKKSSADRQLFRHMTQFFISGGYRSHLIDVLEGIAYTNPRLISEPWVRDAVSDVENLLTDGKVNLAKNYPTKLIDPLRFERVGRPSRFLTYQWLRVRKRFALPLDAPRRG
jgi:hypothetical protein